MPHKELEFGDGSSSGSNQAAPGVYINEATIAKVKDISGIIAADWQQRPYDIGLQLVLEIGKDFQPTMTIGGDFKRGTDGSIIDWGSAWQVRALMDALKIKGKLIKGKLSKEILQQMVGQKVVRLSYVKGKNKNDETKLSYASWNTILPAGNGAVAELLKLWEKSRAKGYPKNFHPELMSRSDDVTFNVSETKQTEETPQPKTSVDEEADGF